jgi:hypothetical protein
VTYKNKEVFTGRKALLTYNTVGGFVKRAEKGEIRGCEKRGT